MQVRTIRAIVREMQRQEDLKRTGRFERTCREMADLDNLAVVAEELAEVADEIGVDAQRRDAEIVQTIACLVNWLERKPGAYAAQFPPRRTELLRKDLLEIGRRARALQESLARGRLQKLTA